MFPTTVTDFALRIVMASVIALVLIKLLRNYPRDQQILLLAYYLSPLICLIPFPTIYLPILKLTSIQLVQPRYLDSSIANTVSESFADPPTPILTVLFLILSFLGLLLFSVRTYLTAALCRRAQQVTDEGQISQLYEIGQQVGLRDAPILKLSDEISSPMVRGIFSSEILLPANWTLSTDELHVVLKHEMMHIRHRDPCVLFLASLTTHLFWWNPLSWYVLRSLKLSQEINLDRKIGISVPYISVLKRAIFARDQQTIPMLGSSHALFSRIRAMGQKQKGSATMTPFAIAVLLSLWLPYKIVSPYLQNQTEIGYDEVICAVESEGKTRLWRMNIDGRNPRPLPELFKDVGGASISPDGNWIAFSRTKNEQEDIYVARVDGSDESTIISTPARDVQPSWSPDGQQLTFSTKVTGKWEVAIVEVRTKAWRFFTKDGNINLESTFHPLGNRILFSSHRDGFQNLWSAKLDGTDLVQLTFDRSEATHGNYSSDGSKIVYSSRRRAKYELTMLDLRTGETMPLVKLHQLDTGEPEWAMDNTVLMTASDGTVPYIGRVVLPGGSVTKISGDLKAVWPVVRPRTRVVPPALLSGTTD